MTSTMFQIIERPERDKKSKWQSGHSQSAQLTKRPRLHCSGGSVCRLQVAHTAQTTAVQRKRSGDCSFNRSSPPEKRPRLQGVSYAFLRKIQETSKEQTFGLKAQQAAEEWGTWCRKQRWLCYKSHLPATWGAPEPPSGTALPGRGCTSTPSRCHGGGQPHIWRWWPCVQRLQLLEDSVPGCLRWCSHGVAIAPRCASNLPGHSTLDLWHQRSSHIPGGKNLM